MKESLLPKRYIKAKQETVRKAIELRLLGRGFDSIAEELETSSWSIKTWCSLFDRLGDSMFTVLRFEPSFKIPPQLKFKWREYDTVTRERIAYWLRLIT